MNKASPYSFDMMSDSPRTPLFLYFLNINDVFDIDRTEEEGHKFARTCAGVYHIPRENDRPCCCCYQLVDDIVVDQDLEN